MTHPARTNRFLNTVEMRRRLPVLRSLPYSVQLEVTTKCNLACIMCARDKYHGRGEHLDDDVLDPVLEQLLPTAQDIIVSSFGEPLLYPRFRDLLARIDPASGLQLGFFTNLLLLDEKMAEDLVRSGVGYVNASIDGASKETYERIRAGGRWETLIEKIDLLVATRRRLGSKTPRLNLCVVGSTLNIDETAQFVEFAHAHGFDSVKYNPNMYVDDAQMEHLALVHEQEKTVRQFRAGYLRALELDMHTNFHQKPYRVPGMAMPALPRPTGSVARLAVNWVKRLYRTRLGWRIDNNWLQSGGVPLLALRLGLRKIGNVALNNIPLAGIAIRRLRKPIPHVIPNDAPPRTCGNPWTHVHVKSDGLVYPCCFSDEVMGDLRTQSFAEIWNGEKYQDLRRSLSTGKYWASCRRASCNWVEGHKSSEYACRIELLDPLAELDGARPATLRVRVTNTGRFRWRPPEHNGVRHRNFVSLAYRLFTERHELIDEGGHVPIPHALRPGRSVEMTLEVRPVRYAGPVRLAIDMVHEGVTWFGERGNNALVCPVRITDVPFAAYLGMANKAQAQRALSDQVGRRAHAEIAVRVRNVGTAPLGATPDTDYLATHWRRAHDNAVVEWEGPRVPIAQPLAPGQETTLLVPVEVPHAAASGAHLLEFDIVREHQEWLSTAWGRPLLAWPVELDAAPNGRRPPAEPIGQCVPHTGNKGIW
jgi:radical SAM protein with 4Fe4S-binding SPASM domain